MKLGQVLTLIGALVLLLPGACFGVVGVMVLPEPDAIGWALLAFAISAGILFVVWRLLRAVARRNRSPPPSPPAS